MNASSVAAPGHWSQECPSENGGGGNDDAGESVMELLFYLLLHCVILCGYMA